MLADGLRHHSWATERLLDVCAELAPEDLERHVPAVYGSMLDTLRHVVDADVWYLWGISGGTLGRDDFDADALALADVRAAAIEAAAGWERLLERDLDPDVDVATSGAGRSFRHATAGIRLAQVVHHGTDHRSQVCTALTTMGVTPPDIDVWEYGETVGRSRFGE